MAKRNKPTKKVTVSAAEPVYEKDALTGLDTPTVTNFDVPFTSVSEDEPIEKIVIGRDYTPEILEKFKSQYNISNETVLFAFNFSELPQFFYQNDIIYFKIHLKSVLDNFNDFSEPIWFSPVMVPRIVGLCENYRIAYEEMISSGVRIA